MANTFGVAKNDLLLLELQSLRETHISKQRYSTLRVDSVVSHGPVYLRCFLMLPSLQPPSLSAPQNVRTLNHITGTDKGIREEFSKKRFLPKDTGCWLRGV